MKQGRLFKNQTSDKDASYGPEQVTWLAQNVNKMRGSFADLQSQVPHFERKPFSVGGGVNTYTDVIIRRPFKEDEVPIPIATVSKQYTLVQHFSLLEALCKGLDFIGISSRSLEAELILTEFGERMCFSMTLPRCGFDPGDGKSITLKINCLNSVDKSLAMKIMLSWFRLVCGNSMLYGESTSFRRVHLGTIDPNEIANYLKNQLDLLPEEKKLYQGWLKTRIKAKRIETWVNGPLAETWGIHLAARTFHIIQTGSDGKVIDRRETTIPPHRRRIEARTEVPGIPAPVCNAFHISQVLSWLTKGRNTIQDQMKKMQQIPFLMHSLLND